MLWLSLIIPPVIVSLFYGLGYLRYGNRDEEDAS